MYQYINKAHNVNYGVTGDVKNLYTSKSSKFTSISFLLNLFHCQDVY